MLGLYRCHQCATNHGRQNVFEYFEKVIAYKLRMREDTACATNFKFSDCRLDDCSLIDERVPIKVCLRSDIVFIPRILPQRWSNDGGLF
jgi:hypothetical protein